MSGIGIRYSIVVDEPLEVAHESDDDCSLVCNPIKLFRHSGWTFTTAEKCSSSHYCPPLHSGRLLALMLCVSRDSYARLSPKALATGPEERL